MAAEKQKIKKLQNYAAQIEGMIMTMPETTGIPLQQITSTLLRRWRLIAGAGLGGAALALVVGAIIPPTYTAKAQLVFAPNRTRVDGAHASEAAVETQVAMLASRSHLQRVLRSLSAEEPGEKMAVVDPQGGGGGLLEPLQSSKDPRPSTPLNPTQSAASAQASENSALVRLASLPMDLALEDLQRHLNVFQENHSQVIGVMFSSKSPDEAAAIANQVSRVYIDYQNERIRKSRESELAEIREQVRRLRDEVIGAEATLQAFQAAHGFGEDGRREAINRQIADLNGQIAVTRHDLADRQDRLASLRSQVRNPDDKASLVEAFGSAALSELYQDEQALYQSRAKLAAAPGSNEPRLQVIEMRLREIQQKAKQLVEQLLSQLESENRTVSVRMRSLEQRLASFQAASNNLAEPEVELRELRRKLAASTQLYERLLQREGELRQQPDAVSDVQLLSPASVPDEPSSPNSFLFIPPALVASCIAGGMLAILFDQLDRGMRSERDVNVLLGYPCIGLVPQVTRSKKLRPHQILVEQPFSAYTEAIRSVAISALQMTGSRQGPKAILVTSSVPGEGKTTLALSFATYAARLQRRVLLIDLDFRHPHVLNEIGIEAQSDALDLLSGRPYDEAIRYIPELGLDCLSLPRHPVDPVTILATRQLPELLGQIRERYDCIVIDSASLLDTAATRLLTSMVDKVLFVVKWGETRREVAQSALRLLSSVFDDNVPRDRLSVVLTQVNLKKHARYRLGDVGESLSRVK